MSIRAKNKSLFGILLLLALLIVSLGFLFGSKEKPSSLVDSAERAKANLEKDYLRSKSQPGKFGGVLRFTHLGRDPKTLNPWIASDATSSYYAGILFEGLLRNDPETNEVVPNLAKSFELFNGGKKIIVTLRENIFWTDGTRITADDVVFTWNDLIRDQIAISSLRDILLVEGEFPRVRKISDRVISFETKEIFAPFLDTVGISVAPKHDIERYFKEKKAKNLEEKQKAFNAYLSINTEPEKIVSSGPFKLNKIKFGERIEFDRNPDYFVINSGGKRLPYTDSLVYTYVLDRNADVFKFLAGESYILEIETPMVALLKGLEAKYDFKVYDLGPSSGTSFLWFNMSTRVPEPKYSWFNNLNFRKAISYAIDRDSIVENVHQGLGLPLFTPESLKSPYLNQSLKDGYKRNLDQARTLLKRAGFNYDKSNKLLDAKGNVVEFNLLTNAGNKQRELMATIISDNLGELGIKVNFKLIEFNNFVSRIMAGEGYEAGILGFTGSNEPNNGANVWKSSGRLHSFDTRTAKSASPLRSWEKEIDRLFLKGVRVMAVDERKKIYDRFQEIVYKQLPYIYLSSPTVMTAASNKLANLRKTKYGGIMPYIYDVYLLD